MNISLTDKHKAWIAAQVAHGMFKSPEDAIRQLIDEHLLFTQIPDDDDIEWLKPMVAEGLAELGKGEVISHAEYRADVNNYLADFKKHV